MKNRVNKSNTSKSKIQNSHLEKQKIQNLKTNDVLKFTEFFDFYSIRKQNIEKYFQSLENFIPIYQQTFTELQLEYLQLCENIFKSSFFFQIDTTRKLNLGVSYAISRVISDAMETTIKSYRNRNEMILSSIESFRDIIKDWNIMFLSYADIYKKFNFKTD